MIMIKRKYLVFLVFVLAGTVLLLTGCLAQNEPPATPLPPTASPTSIPATITPSPATNTPLPTPTLIPTPSQPAATTITNVTNKEWDYVVIGDSIVFSFLYTSPNTYAGFLARDLGVKINIHRWARGGLSSQEVLDALLTNETLRQDVREAEVIIFDVPRVVFRAARVYINGDYQLCGGSDNQDCLRESLNTYKEHVDAIIAEIVSLRSPSDALIRTFDAYTYWSVNDSKTIGTFDVVNQYWQEANDYLIQVATENHIPVARTNEAFNGPNGDEDPVEKGYVKEDAVHPTDKGMELMAEIMRAVGYEYAP
jgi:hypothetical protein